MKITKEFLTSHNACKSGMDWVTKNKLIGLGDIDFLNKLMEGDKFQWANWLIVNLMNKTKNVMYAIFAAEQVIDIFENKYSDDKRPRKAIEAAKEYLSNSCEKTKNAVYATTAAATTAAATAADADAAAAAAAADAAYAAAAYAAADAAYAAADAAYATYAAADADAAYATAADAAADAAYAAADAAYATAARKEMQTRIINYGIELIKQP